MGPSFSIRKAAATESPALAALWMGSRTASIPAIPAPVHSLSEVQRWFADVVLPSQQVWVAQVANGPIVGLLVLHAHSVDQLYIDPAWFDHGIGSRLLAVAKLQCPKGSGSLDLQIEWSGSTLLRAPRFRRGWLD
jgi:putative acetyltransferase